MDKHIRKLAEIIEAYVAERGVSARELALKAEVSPSYIYKILKRVPFQPTVDTLARIARAMNLSVGDLLRYCKYIDTDSKQQIYSTSELLDRIPEQYRHLFIGKNEKYVQFAVRLAREEIEPEKLDRLLRVYLELTD